MSVREVMKRTGRGRLKVLTALQTARGHLEIEGAYRAGDLRGYQERPGAGWAVHVADVDSWVRGEVPAPVPVEPARREPGRHRGTFRDGGER